MAASRNQAAFSGVGARSSDWFWSCNGVKREGSRLKLLAVANVGVITTDRLPNKSEVNIQSEVRGQGLHRQEVSKHR